LQECVTNALTASNLRRCK